MRRIIAPSSAQYGARLLTTPPSFRSPQIPPALASRLASAISRAERTVTDVIGRMAVEHAERQWKTAVLSGRPTTPTGLLGKVVGARRTAEALWAGSLPPALEDALWVAVIADALSVAHGAPGSENVIARLAGNDSDQAAFELIAGAYVARRLPSSTSPSGAYGDRSGRLRFLSAFGHQPTPDLEVYASCADRGPQWISMECKRQNERSGAEERRAQIMKKVTASVEKEVDRAAISASLYVITANEPDDAECKRISELLRSALAEARELRVAAVTRADPAAGGIRVVVHEARGLAIGQLPPISFGANGFLSGDETFGATSILRLLSSQYDLRPRYALTMRLGPALGPAGALSRLRQACRQLPASGPGIVALWLRNSRADEREAIFARIAQEFRSDQNTRVSAVLCTWLHVEPAFASTLCIAPDLSRGLGARLLCNPYAAVPIVTPQD
jgi:hypothetical protein